MHKLHAPESCGSKSAHIDPSWQTSHFTDLLGPKPKRLGSRCTRDNVSTVVVLIYLDTDAGLPTVPLGLYEINMFFLWSKDVFFARSFASSMFSSLTTLFALMGFQQIRKPMQMYSKGLSRLRLLLSLLRSLSSPKQQILHLKRRGSGRMNLNFDSSICLLWLPKVLFFGIKCSVFGISFSGMII